MPVNKSQIFLCHSMIAFILTVDHLYQVAKLMSSTDNEIFAHYIFMDNKFIMSTASGLPLKFGLSGTFTPGAKGGIRIAPDMVNYHFFLLNLAFTRCQKT